MSSKKTHYKNCLKATELENEINQLEKNKVIVDSPTKDTKEFIKINKSILKKAKF